MISDSVPWRYELLRIARRLERKTRQEHWTERSSFRVEKDLMMAGYAIRRLLEARKLSDSLAAKQVPVVRHPRIGPIPDFYNRDEIDALYDIANPIKDQITLAHLANQIIHSFVLVLSCDEVEAPYEGEDGIEVEGSYLFNGYFIASEKERMKHLYFLDSGTLVALCRSIAMEDVVGVDMRRDANGVATITRVIASTDPEWLAEIQMKSPEATRPYA
ncbi:hypothetical protein SAMN04489743_2861 [Pseudarthrobacter equi]|uniref:Uncharacterized protein n=1 Tax=Pseudarthrobacter equi TaxID=728066 RepID=A0A1H2AAT3_9MICC|nr:hypothetical protein [Pseudarthrobacter equi]SDT42606.1 hypothetical protein SAMN04489743_2861 [Pseudarthrobacter equi]